MADANGADPPEWFERALAVATTEHEVFVDGCPIHYLAWGERGLPGLVFIHGGAAHAHWWSFLAPLFADNYRVAALDLSGHGDSGRRDEYGLDPWTKEVTEVAKAAAMAASPVLIGHSMGGFVALGSAATYPDEVAGAIVLDSPVRKIDAEVEAARDGRIFRPPRVYPDLDAALRRFRTVPEQACYLPYVKDYVARRSLRPVEGGWQWKFDARIFVPSGPERKDLLERVNCRVALLAAEHGLVTPDIGAYMYEQLGRVAPVVEIPEAGHHLMLDQPMHLLTALRALLADWEHSVPFRRAV